MTLVRTTTHLPLRSRPASVKAGVDRSCFGSKRVATTPNCSGLQVRLDCADGRQPEVTRAGLTRLYHGPLTYENGALQRVATPVGYIADRRFHAFYPDYQGNVRVVGAGGTDFRQSTHYYPYGLPFAEGYAPARQPHKYSGKELITDKGLNVYDFHARMSDPACVAFESIDLLSDKYTWVSPYSLCAANPVKYSDPLGLNPIYSPEGEFLGTDDRGLKGERYILNKEDYDIHLTPQQILDVAIPEENLSADVLEKINKHYESLPSRPDYDGYLTLEEANDWYKNGKGEALYVDLDQIDLSNIYSLGDEFIEQKKTFNLITASGNLNDGLVYGNITLKRYPGDRVRAYADTYDFDMKSWNSINNIGRNICTIIGDIFAGSGKKFEIIFYGSKKLKTRAEIPLSGKFYLWIKGSK